MVKNWSDAFGHSFSGADRLGGAPNEWLLVRIERIRKGQNNFYVLDLFMRRVDGMEGRKYIRSESNTFLKDLESRLQSYIGKSWEDIGNMKVDE